MTNMELETDIEALDMEMGDITIHYCPVIPNPEGEPTAELKTADIEGTIYEIVDEEARTELENKVDKVEGKDLSTNDYTDEDKAIVDGVTTALDGKVDKDGDKVLSDNNYSDEDKAIVDGVTSALNDKADKSDTYTKTEVDSALDNKVDKVEGKNLSENDFTDTLKDKLDGIEAEANKTVVDNSVTATSTNPVESKAIYNLLNDLLPEAEETGNPIAISNASGFNAKALTVDMLPIQDLHGYDSPWVGGGGKNKLPPKDSTTTANNVTYTPNADESITVTAQSITGTATLAYGGIYGVNSANPDLCKPLPNGLTAGGSLFMKIEGNPEGMELLCQFQKSDGSIIENKSTPNTLSTTIPSNASFVYICLRINKNTISLPINSTVKCFVGSEQVTAWTPYSNICPISGRTQTTVSVNSEDTTIQFGQTVYGGEVDVTSGGTSEEWVELNITSAENIKRNNAKQYYIRSSIAFEVNSTNIVSNKFKTASSGNGVCFLNQDGNIRFNTVDEYESAEALFNAIGNIQFVAKLATPTTINTPATTISLNKGNNTLSTSGDNMDLKYSKTPQ